MFSTLRIAYGAGWRAGMAGAHYLDMPFKRRRQFLLAYCWFAGWEIGIKKRLRDWLKSRRVG